MVDNMKKQKVNKVEQVEVQAEDVKPEEERLKVSPFAAWDNIMFMRRRPMETTSNDEQK